MINIQKEYYFLMVQYEPDEKTKWWLYKVFEHIADAEAFKKHCIKMDIKNGFKRIYKIFTYKLDENA